MNKTIAYDHLKLHSPRSLKVSQESLEAMTTIPNIHVNVLRDDLIRWNNDYKLLLEFLWEFFDTKEVTSYDLLRWYDENFGTKVFGLSFQEIRKLLVYYKTHTGDLRLEKL